MLDENQGEKRAGMQTMLRKSLKTAPNGLKTEVNHHHEHPITPREDLTKLMTLLYLPHPHPLGEVNMQVL